MIERVSRILGTEVRRLMRVPSSGYTVAFHGIAELRVALPWAARELDLEPPG